MLKIIKKEVHEETITETVEYLYGMIVITKLLF
jgi:hypothetical protein